MSETLGIMYQVTEEKLVTVISGYKWLKIHLQWLKVTQPKFYLQMYLQVKTVLDNISIPFLRIPEDS